jgi:hypothetical protein
VNVVRLTTTGDREVGVVTRGEEAKSSQYKLKEDKVRGRQRPKSHQRDRAARALQERHVRNGESHLEHLLLDRIEQLLARCFRHGASVAFVAGIGVEEKVGGRSE